MIMQFFWGGERGGGKQDALVYVKMVNARASACLYLHDS